MSQLLGGKETLVINSLTIETDEMIDTQIVDIGIVSSVLTGEILTEIGAVSTNSLSKLRNGQVVLQVKLRVNAMML